MTPVIGKEERIINAWHSGWEADPEMTVSEWADERRILAGEGSVEPGKFRTSRTPYLKEIMDSLSPSSPVREVKVMKGTQLGFSEAGNNLIGFIIDIAPGPTAMYMPTEDKAKEHAEFKLNPSINATPVLREKVVNVKGKDAKNTILMKKFKGGFLLLSTAASAAALSSLSIKYLILDEIDRFKRDVGGEGNPVSLAQKRTDAFKSVCKIYKLSTPTEEGLSNIEHELINSDRRRYYVPCPYCEWMQHLTFKGISFEKNNKHELTSDVYYRCEHCNKLIEEYYKTSMMDYEVAEWRPQNPGHEHRGYTLPSFYSPVGWLSWSDIVKEWLEAQRTRDKTQLKTVINTRFAELWTEGEKTVNENTLTGRREKYGPEIPANAVILTAGVDIQVDRIEVEIDAWGVGEESWGLEHKILSGDPVRQQVWKDLDEYLMRLWKHELGPSFPVSGVAIDTGYLTQQCYTFVKPRQLRRVFGYPQKVFAIKGHGDPLKPFLNRATRNNLAKVNLFTLGVNTAKDTLHGRFNIHEPGPGYVHHNFTFDEEYFKQVTSEVRKRRKGARVWEAKPGARTEGLDLKVYSLAALGLLNIKIEPLVELLQERVRQYKQSGDPAIKQREDPRVPVPERKRGRRMISRGLKRGDL